MGNPLQQPQDPRELAASCQVIEIAREIEDFERLAEIVGSDLAALDSKKIPLDWRARKIAGVLRFGYFDPQERLPALQGRLTATIDAVCQRCLEPVVVPLATDLHWLFAGDQALDRDGKLYEVWELDGDELVVAELIEEALIMALPFVAMHDGDTQCAATATSSVAREKTTLPFANLKTQMEQEN